MKKKVTQIITELNPGGAERIVYALATAIDEFDTTVIALDGRGEYAKRLEAKGIKVIDIKARSKLDIGVIGRLQAAIKEDKPDLIHTHLIHATVIGRLAARKSGIPLVSTCHIAERRFRPWHFWLNRLSAKYAKCEVCVSEAVKKFQIERTGLPEKFFRVIYNGVDTDLFHPAEEKNSVRRELGLPEDKLLAGYLGRFDKQKGADIFLQALNDIKTSEINTDSVLFLLAGYGTEEAVLKTQAENIKQLNIKFSGYQAEPQKLLQALDICIVPSRYEGFGLVALEAALCGTIVISSDADSLPEIIKDNQNGLIFANGSPSELRKKLCITLNNLPEYKKLTKQRDELAAAFSEERMVNNHIQLYRELI